MLSFTFLYASFGKRFMAFVMDVAVLLLISFFILQPFVDFLGFRELSETVRNQPFSVVIIKTYGMWALVTAITAWLYFALQESSRKQATLGKRIMGIQVFTLNEERLDFGTATARFWAKLLSGSIALVGFFMMLFDPQRRTLHDMLAGTQVLQARGETLESFDAPWVFQGVRRETN